jgi:hypothetical protein
MNNPLSAYINSLLDEAEARMDRAGIPKGGDVNAVPTVGQHSVTGAAHPNNAATCKLVPCPYCNASGYAPGQSRDGVREQFCTHCAGSGEILTDSGEL